MSNDHDNSLSTAAAIGVAILLLLVILVVPVGFGLFYFSRSQAQYQRAVMAEQQARAEAELVRAQEAVARSQVDLASLTDLTFDVARDGTITIDEQTFDLDQLAQLVAEKSSGKKINLVIDAECPAILLGEISQRCLSAGAEWVSVRQK